MNKEPSKSGGSNGGSLSSIITFPQDSGHAPPAAPGLGTNVQRWAIQRWKNCTRRYWTSMVSTVIVPPFSVPITFAMIPFDCDFAGSDRSARLLRAAEALLFPAASSL